jgi:pyruvate-formate lyase
LPRYGQGVPADLEMTTRIGAMWVSEVERVGARMDRVKLWPGFYSHMVHLAEGAVTPATPDGRHAGDPMSENLSPSAGTPACSPTSVLRSMRALPFDHTPSGAATFALAVAEGAPPAAEVIEALLRSHFEEGGLQLQVSVADRRLLADAMSRPELYPDLMVRVAGYSAYFTRLSADVQRDILSRFPGSESGGCPEA